LERARASSGDPWDEQEFELGDAVEVREAGSREVERFVLVGGGPGARIDARWISDRSPLGKALLGSRRGDVVEIRAPIGRIGYEVVDFRARRLTLDLNLPRPPGRERSSPTRDRSTGRPTP
jgi:transcription elongation factor GreA